MDSREKFEAWLKSTGQNPPYAKKRGYFEIWQASRAAIEIELPQEQYIATGNWSGVYVMHPDDVRKCIESAGLKVRE